MSRSVSRRARLIEALTGTAQIDPDDYSPITSTNRLTSFGYALAGWLYMLRRQKNTRIQGISESGSGRHRAVAAA